MSDWAWFCILCIMFIGAVLVYACLDRLCRHKEIMEGVEYEEPEE